MTTEATLLTRSIDVRSLVILPPHMDNSSFDLRVVHGIELPNSPTILHKDILYADMQEEALLLPEEKAERLAEFILHKIVEKPESYKSCFTFAAFMHGG